MKKNKTVHFKSFGLNGLNHVVASFKLGCTGTLSIPMNGPFSRQHDGLVNGWHKSVCLHTQHTHTHVKHTGLAQQRVDHPQKNRTRWQTFPSFSFFFFPWAKGQSYAQKK